MSKWTYFMNKNCYPSWVPGFNLLPGFSWGPCCPSLYFFALLVPFSVLRQCCLFLWIVNVACVSGSSIRFFSVYFIIYSLQKILKCLTGFSWLTVGLLIIIARSPFTCQSQFPFRWQSYRHQILQSRRQYLIWKNFKDPAFTKTLTLNW